MSNSDLFLEAFGGDNKPEGRNEGVKYSTADRENLFKLGFGQEPSLKDYEAPTLVDYEWTGNGATPDQLLTLDSYIKSGTQYRDLPMGLRALVKPKRVLAKELRKEEDETGMTLDQRQSAFNALEFGVDYLVALSNAGLSDEILQDELQSLQNKFPAEQVEIQLQETNQQLLAQLKASQKAREVQAQQQAHEAQVKAELAEAQRNIELMNASSAADLLTADALARNSEQD